MTIYLYVKTHRKTGLKYFGKTIKDPLTYKGSGTRWLHHIRKHGDDCVTEIIGSCDDPDKCEMAALKFSLENDIVVSNAWANLKPETAKMVCRPAESTRRKLRRRCPRRVGASLTRTNTKTESSFHTGIETRHGKLPIRCTIAG